MNVFKGKTHSHESVPQSLVRQSLSDPIKHFVVGGGKRIRGALTQLAYDMAGGDGRVDESVFAAIESLHAGSLVIDDIQDGSDHRRGKPTLHRIVGTPLAINAGNWMYFQALETLVHAPFNCEVRSSMTTAMIQSARICHEGQALDLAARVDRLPPSDWRSVATQISEQKTGELVRLAMSLGGIAGGASRNFLAAMDRFGIAVGVALQMRNDLDELASLAKASVPAAGKSTQTKLGDNDSGDYDSGDNGLGGSDFGNSDLGRNELRDDDLRNARVTWPWVWIADADTHLADALSRKTIGSAADAIEIAQTILPKISAIGDAAIAQRLDRETRLLGEFVLDSRAFDSLETVLRPIRLGHSTNPSEQELTDVCRH